MATKVSDEFLRHIENAKKEDSQTEIPVIVTIRANTDPKMLEHKGLKIKHIFYSISAISGTLAANKVIELVQLDQVVKIEYDGQMHAF